MILAPLRCSRTRIFRHCETSPSIITAGGHRLLPQSTHLSCREILKAKGTDVQSDTRLSLYLPIQRAAGFSRADLSPELYPHRILPALRKHVDDPGSFRPGGAGDFSQGWSEAKPLDRIPNHNISTAPAGAEESSVRHSAAPSGADGKAKEPS